MASESKLRHIYDQLGDYQCPTCKTIYNFSIWETEYPRSIDINCVACDNRLILIHTHNNGDVYKIWEGCSLVEHRKKHVAKNINGEYVHFIGLAKEPICKACKLATMWDCEITKDNDPTPTIEQRCIYSSVNNVNFLYDEELHRLNNIQVIEVDNNNCKSCGKNNWGGNSYNMDIECLVCNNEMFHKMKIKYRELYNKIMCEDSTRINKAT